MTFYILDGHTPVEASLDEYSEWIKTGNRIVEVGYLFIDEPIFISTVFLLVDHSFDHCGPVLFETMVFGGEADGEQWRYRTWDEAVEGHESAIRFIVEQHHPNAKNTEELITACRVAGRMYGGKMA